MSDNDFSELDNFFHGTNTGDEDFSELDNIFYTQENSLFSPIVEPRSESNIDPEVDDRWEFTKGFSSGVDNIQATVGGVVGLLGDAIGSDTVRDYGMDVYKRNTEEAQANQGRVTDIDQIEGFGDFVDFAAQAVGQMIPSAISIIAGGGVGGVAAKVAAKKAVNDFVKDRTGKELNKKALDRLTDKVVKKAVQKGQMAGMFAGSSAIQTGSIYGDAASEGAEGAKAIWSSLAGGAVTGALDVLPVMGVAKRFGFGGDLEKHLLKRYHEMSIPKRVGETAAITGLKEAGTEGLQTFIEEATKAYILDRGLPEDIGHMVLNAAATGAVGGTVLGGAGGIAKPQGPQEQAPISIKNMPHIPGEVPFQETINGARKNTGWKPPTGPIIPTGPQRGLLSSIDSEMDAVNAELDAILKNTSINSLDSYAQSPITDPTNLAGQQGNLTIDNSGLYNIDEFVADNKVKSPESLLSPDKMGHAPIPVEGRIDPTGKFGGPGFDKQTRPSIEGELLPEQQFKNNLLALDVDAIEGELAEYDRQSALLNLGVKNGLISPEEAAQVQNNIDNAIKAIGQQPNYQAYLNRQANNKNLANKAAPKGPFEQDGEVVGKNSKGETIYQDDNGKRYIRKVDAAKGNNRFYELEKFRGNRFKTEDEPAKTNEPKQDDLIRELEGFINNEQSVKTNDDYRDENGIFNPALALEERQQLFSSMSEPAQNLMKDFAVKNLEARIAKRESQGKNAEPYKKRLEEYKKGNINANDIVKEVNWNVFFQSLEGLNQAQKDLNDTTDLITGKKDAKIKSTTQGIENQDTAIQNEQLPLEETQDAIDTGTTTTTKARTDSIQTEENITQEFQEETRETAKSTSEAITKRKLRKKIEKENAVIIKKYEDEGFTLKHTKGKEWSLDKTGYENPEILFTQNIKNIDKAIKLYNDKKKRHDINYYSPEIERATQESIKKNKAAKEKEAEDKKLPERDGSLETAIKRIKKGFETLNFIQRELETKADRKQVYDAIKEKSGTHDAYYFNTKLDSQYESDRADGFNRAEQILNLTQPRTKNTILQEAKEKHQLKKQLDELKKFTIPPETVSIDGEDQTIQHGKADKALEKLAERIKQAMDLRGCLYGN